MLLQTNVANSAQESVGMIGGLLQGFLSDAIAYAPKILLALIVLFIGFRVINWITGIIKKQFKKQKYDESLAGFLSAIISILMKAALFIAVAQTLGVAATSFVAILGAAGLAIGLALQGSLANFAGGVMILLFKPFKVGDYVEAQGLEGFVREVNVFVTKLVTPDNKTHYIPNGPLASGNITNVSEQGMVRLQIPVGIGYDADIKAARNSLVQMASNHPLSLKDPAPAVVVTELADSSVNVDIHVWCEPGNAPGLTAAMFEQAKETLDKEGIDIPFPQQVLHNVGS